MISDVMTLTVEGVEEISRAMNGVARKLADGSLVARAALVIERQAKQNWGHGKHRGGFPNVQTGRLRASIATEIVNANMARVGTNVTYAPFVEFGHAIVSRFKGNYGSYQEFSMDRQAPAYPFLGPTIEQTKSQISDVMIRFGNELGADWGK